MKKKAILFLVSFIIAIGFLFGLYKLMNSTTFQVSGEIIDHKDTEKKLVALTFDDGPNENTDEILRILEEKSVRATFFLIGENIEKNASEAKKIVAAGHQLGNHSYSHTRMIFKSPGFVASEIEKTNTLIKDAGYAGEITFRPPYGKKLFVLPMYLNQHHIKTIMWNHDPLQELPPTSTSQEMSVYVSENAKPGSIILIHPWYGLENNSRDAIPNIIDRLKEKGFEFVTVHELLAE